MNIKEIAELAGVSKSTVSRVLNGKNDVSESTKNKVLEIIRKEQFVPNRYASNLSTAKSRLIAVMVPDFKNVFYIELIDTIESELKKKGYNMFLCNSRGNNDFVSYYFDLLVSLRTEGLIYISPRFSLKGLEKLGNIPIISIDGKINSKIPSIVCNHKKGIITSFNKLIEKGCKSILYVTGIEDFYSVAAKNKGYEEVVHKYKDSVHITKMKTSLDPNENYVLIKEQMLSQPNIDGVVCINDELAFTTMRIARELNLSIPQDFLLIGYDDSPYINRIAPGLSSIKMPIMDLANNSVSMLINYLSKSKKPASKKLDIELVERESVLR